MPGPLHLSQLEAFLSEHGHRFPVRWTSDLPGPEGGYPEDAVSADHEPVTAGNR
jgi:hypothetical protein